MTTQKTKAIERQLRAAATEERREKTIRFFKTGAGQYGENDVFIGIAVPDIRQVVKVTWTDVGASDIAYFLTHPIHEFRMYAVLVLVKKFEHATQVSDKSAIPEVYLQHIDYINTWDLVDASAHKILGRLAMLTGNAGVLENLSQSANPWHQRIAIVGTMFHVKNGIFDLTKTFVRQHNQTKDDLMQKANGWLLREMGLVDRQELLLFLRENYHQLPRTTLRYAIEKFSPQQRQTLLKGDFNI